MVAVKNRDKTDDPMEVAVVGDPPQQQQQQQQSVISQQQQQQQIVSSAAATISPLSISSAASSLPSLSDAILDSDSFLVSMCVIRRESKVKAKATRCTHCQSKHFTSTYYSYSYSLVLQYAREEEPTFSIFPWELYAPEWVREVLYGTI